MIGASDFIFLGSAPFVRGAHHISPSFFYQSRGFMAFHGLSCKRYDTCLIVLVLEGNAILWGKTRGSCFFILFDALFDQGQPRCRPFWRNLSKLNWKGGSIFRIVLITSMLSKKHVPCGLSYKEMQSQDSMNFNPRAPRHPEAILVNSIWEGSWQKLPEIHAGSAWYASPSYQPMGTVGESAMGFTAFDWSLVYQEQNCFC